MDKGTEFSFSIIEECFTAAIEIARQAGEVIKAAFQQDKTVMLKDGSADLVTETDQRVEQIIISFLQDKFPTHCFIGEESVAAGKQQAFTDGPTWMIDPIDGTTNFVHRWPYVAVSIGLCVNKEVVVGVVYNPILDEMFSAKKNQGAFLNNKPICVGKQTELSASLLVQEFGSQRDDKSVAFKQGNILKMLKHPVQAIRCCGSAALDLCMLATGAADAYFEFGIHCWDIAAGGLIVKEAGGYMADTEGGPLDLMSRRCLAAGTEQLAIQISRMIDHVRLERD